MLLGVEGVAFPAVRAVIRGDVGRLGVVVSACRALADGRRLKKGMPEGVRRGLRRLDLDRPGLVVTTEGAPVAAVVFPVLLLLKDSVLWRSRTEC